MMAGDDRSPAALAATSSWSAARSLGSVVGKSGLIDGDVVTIGITQFAADELTDITFVELPKVGTKLSAGKRFGEMQKALNAAEKLAQAAQIIERQPAAMTLRYLQTLTEIADQFQYGLNNRAEKWGAPVVGAPEEERRDDFVEPYLRNDPSDRVALILKAREPARILVAIGGKDNDSPHLEFKQRGVNHFNFYVVDKHWDRMFVRMGPYFPFSARVCLNQHHWLAQRLGYGHGENAREDVDTASRRKRCDEPDRLGGILLRKRVRDERSKQECSSSQQRFHLFLLQDESRPPAPFGPTYFSSCFPQGTPFSVSV